MDKKKQIPSISVVMPLYNKENDVKRALDSALAQTFHDFELIVINDGSTDRGPDIVRGGDDQRVKLVDQKNAGVAAARNRGIQEAKADLIAFLDADDEWKPGFLETIMRLYSNHPECAVFATSFSCREKNGTFRQPIYRGMPAGPWEGVLGNYFEIASQSDPPLCSSAVAVKKEALIAIGGFPVGVTSGEDLLTWARLAVKNKISYCTIPQAVFWVPAAVTDRPGRFADSNDFVAKELEVLLEEAPIKFKKSLGEYLSLWHTMRASIFIQLGRRRESIREIKAAAKWSRCTIKLLSLYIIALSPPILSKLFYSAIRSFYKICQAAFK